MRNACRRDMRNARHAGSVEEGEEVVNMMKPHTIPATSSMMKPQDRAQSQPFGLAFLVVDTQSSMCWIQMIKAQKRVAATVPVATGCYW